MRGFAVIGVIFSIGGAISATTAPSTQPMFEIVGHIDAPAIRESSGIVASRKNSGVFWTHNDSGNDPVLYAIDAGGKLLGQFRVKAPNVDWEDIAVDDEGHLYIADIGNNARNRWQVQVYQVNEPDPAEAGQAEPLRALRTWRLTYADEPFDAEAFFVRDGWGYVISKQRASAQAAVWGFELRAGARPIGLQQVMALPTRLPVTAADASADGRLLAVMTIIGPIIFQLEAEGAGLKARQCWQATFLDPSAEAICFLDNGLLATTEGRRVVRFPVQWSQFGLHP